MKFIKTNHKDVFLINLISEIDFRGDFTRIFCEDVFKANSIVFKIKQTSLVSNKNIYTLRGLHYQEKPHEEQKVLFCLKGKIWDVLVDLRQNLGSYGKWHAFELDERNNQGLYIPKGFAHGYITLTDDVQLLYFMDEFYYPKLSKGIKWNDTKINIKWPYSPKIISEKDKNLPKLDEI